MSASLVGSEMCIRDRLEAARSCFKILQVLKALFALGRSPSGAARFSPTTCLLYTSDAADDM
eukprot:14355515-Alexandrium_andersonii.AAC.1